MYHALIEGQKRRQDKTPRTGPRRHTRAKTHLKGRTILAVKLGYFRHELCVVHPSVKPSANRCLIVGQPLAAC